MYRLPSHVRPVSYALEFFTNLEDDKSVLNGFHGIATIDIRVQTPSSTIHMHVGKKLTIGTATACMNDTAEKVVLNVHRRVQDIPETESVAAFTHPRNEPMTGRVVLRVEFRGPYNTAAAGLYTSRWKGFTTLATQCQATSARDVFPCFDEPSFKATFALTVHARFPSLSSSSTLPWTVLSNMPCATQTAETHVFDVTPVMSTYLFAFVVAPLVPNSKHVGSTVVRVWAYPNDERFTSLPLSFAIDTLHDMTTLFGIPYALPKLDLVPVFDFDAGAMENWGLITFRPTLLYVDVTTPPRASFNAYVTIAHELAHQWFGNLVTMAWWDEIWLNESFATFAATWTCSRIAAPVYNYTYVDAWVAFLCSEMVEALELDALPSTRAIVPPPDFLHTSADIEQLFDSKAYAKGAVVLRMLACLLGLDGFSTGLHAYLTRHAYGNGTSNDLWTAFTASTGVDVAAFMTPWLYTRGFPIVTVDSAGMLQQTPFLKSDSRSRSHSHSHSHWPLPVLRSVIVPERFVPLLSYPNIVNALASDVAVSADIPTVRDQYVVVNSNADTDANVVLYPELYVDAGFVIPALHDQMSSSSSSSSSSGVDVLTFSATQLSKVLSMRIRIQHGMDTPSMHAVRVLEAVANDTRVHADVRDIAEDTLEDWDGICARKPPAASISDLESNDLLIAECMAVAIDDTKTVPENIMALRTLAALQTPERIREVMRWAMRPDTVRPTNFVYLLLNDASTSTSITSRIRTQWLQQHWDAVRSRQGKHGMEQVLTAVLRGINTSSAYKAWRRFLTPDKLEGIEAAASDALHEARMRVHVRRAVRLHVCTNK